ncbi:MAG: hypothetical protein FJX29_10050, partial [Alphaproteobacteria bacterium]|nr:hypothetical protein [Alphaproteobacteria bacterium]
RRRGLSCPHDISVTGFNDMAMVDRINPPLTTVRIQQYRVGQAAAELLLERIHAPSRQQPPKHMIMPVELIVRQSTCPPPDVPVNPPTNSPTNPPANLSASLPAGQRPPPARRKSAATG